MEPAEVVEKKPDEEPFLFRDRSLPDIPSLSEKEAADHVVKKPPDHQTVWCPVCRKVTLHRLCGTVDSRLYHCVACKVVRSLKCPYGPKEGS